MANPHGDGILGPGVRAVHDDGSLLVVAKPSGVLSVPAAGGGKSPCVFRGSFDARQRRFQLGDATVWILHRLDRETSGLLVATRDEADAERLRAAFEAGQVKKFYTALLTASPRPAEGTWDDHLVTHGNGSGLRTRTLDGPPPNARLHYRVVERLGSGPALVGIELVTGKTHQIRVQAARRGLPVVGDGVYGDFARNREIRKATGLRRLFLHAGRILLPHPRTGAPLDLAVPLPDELVEVLGKLRSRPRPLPPTGSGARRRPRAGAPGRTRR